MNKSNLLVVIATHNGDFNLTTDLVKWIGELDGKLPFPVLIGVDATVERERFAALHETAKEIFSNVRTLPVIVPATGWKPNSMFLQLAKYVRENYSCPFLWLEPDCVPLKPNWLFDINEAYQKSPFRYLGAVIEQTGQRGLPPKHLTGCSVYPNDAYADFERMPDVNSGRQAWDIGGGEKIAWASQHTPLIQHFWGSQDKPPVFVETRAPDAPENHVMLDFIKPEAVMFHRCKGGELIPLLRKNKIPSSPPAPLGASETKEKYEELSDTELEKLTPPAQPETILH